eukprot:1203454-Pyramimonas_sp.AAC.1
MQMRSAYSSLRLEVDSLLSLQKLGESIPYSKERVEQWGKKMLSDAINLWISGEMIAAVHFLPGKRDASGDSIAGQVSVEKVRTHEMGPLARAKAECPGSSRDAPPHLCLVPFLLFVGTPSPDLNPSLLTFV